MRYEIEHVSRYRYTVPVRHSALLLCLQPRADRGQHLRHFAVSTAPPASLSGETDCFGNTKHVLIVHREHEALEVSAHSTVETAPAAARPVSLVADAWEALRSRRAWLAHWDFMQASAFARPSPALTAFTDRLNIAPAGDPLASLWRLADTLYLNFQYLPGVTSAVSPIERILETGRGGCQDDAHVMITIARSWGVPTRYVSGYMYVDRQPLGMATHAWVECWLPDHGWIGFDPTNRRRADERYVRIAVGRDYQDVAPTRGILLGGGDSQLEVDVRMRPISEVDG